MCQLDTMSPQSSVSRPSLALYSSTTQTAMLETTAPMNEVLLPTNSLPLFTNVSPLLSKLKFAPIIAFLSYLRLSIYMSVVAIAIVVSFHLKSEPTPLELRMARPLGITFWFLSLCCLGLGFGNYVKTVEKYSRRMAIVQTGWKTQSVSSSRFLLFMRFGKVSWEKEEGHGRENRARRVERTLRVQTRSSAKEELSHVEKRGVNGFVQANTLCYRFSPSLPFPSWRCACSF